MSDWPNKGAQRVLAALLRIGWTVEHQTDSRLRAEEAWKWKVVRKAAKDYYRHTGKS